MTNTDAQQRLIDVFPEFYNSPVIQVLAHEPRWTVSDSEKVPIDMRQLIRAQAGLVPSGEAPLRGAKKRDQTCLVTLDELTQALPQAQNNAFFLQARIDKVMVLDIEPDCPAELVEQLLAVPAFYAERSMSGKGYHLLLPVPDNFAEFPLAMDKVKLQHRLRWFEVLIEHWITFTRNAVQLPPAIPGNWERIYASLAAEAKPAPVAEVDVDTDKPQIPKEQEILNLIVSQTRITKSLEDFHGDQSRYEFSVMGCIYNSMMTMTGAFETAEDVSYDDTARAWLVFLAATKILPHREKHEQMRNGMPLLLNNAVSMIARRRGQAQERTKTS